MKIYTCPKCDNKFKLNYLFNHGLTSYQGVKCPKCGYILSPLEAMNFMFENEVNIVTGNKNKQKEIKEILSEDQYKLNFFDIDLDEVLADDPETIVIYKTLDAQKIIEKNNIVTEDTTLFVNGEFFPEIKWKMDELKEGDVVEMIVTLGYYRDEVIYIYQNKIEGIIHLDRENKYSFGFDNILFIGDKCLGDYKLEHPIRDVYKELGYDKYIKNVDIKSIDPWNGEWQNS